MRPGKWTRPRRCRCGPASGSRGCGSSTNAVAPCCGRPFSPRGSWSQVPPADTQAQLRLAFERWGLPERFRVDNGVPWGSPGDLPTDLALWLIGLGVAMLWNPPRRPQDNGVVERSQGTAKRWAEPGACASAEELQQRLEFMDKIQISEYPSIYGISRLDTFPDLKHSGRSYTREWEETHWSLRAVGVHLAGYAVRRRVSKLGSVSLYGRNHYIGIINKMENVYVSFDPEDYEWIFSDEASHQLRRQAAPEISRERIVGLTVTNRRKGKDVQ